MNSCHGILTNRLVLNVIYTASMMFLFRADVLPAQDRTATRTPISSELQFRLDQKTRWLFPNNPLSDVLKISEKLYDIKIVVDKKSLAKNGIKIGQVVHSESEGTVSELLTEILLPIDLEWVAKGDTIHIRAQDQSLRIKQEANATQSLKRQLSKLIRYDIEENRLENVVLYLSSRHDVQILIDTASLESAEISSEIQLNGEGLTNLRHALNKLLNPAGLTWIANQNRILIRAIQPKTENVSAN